MPLNCYRMCTQHKIKGKKTGKYIWFVFFRNSTEFEEQKILTASGHPVSALCILPPDGEQFGLIAVASGTDHIIRIYRMPETNPLYQLQGHTDTGITSWYCYFYIVCLTGSVLFWATISGVSVYSIYFDVCRFSISIF